MKYLFFILIGIAIISCQSQTKTDLLSLKLDADLSSIIQDDKQFKKNQDPNLGLICYNTSKLDNYYIGEIKLTTYSFPNGNVADYNNLSIFVTNKNKDNYIGFKYNSVNQEETKYIVNYLKKIYPNYNQSDTRGHGNSYFWDIPKINAWIFTSQGISVDKNGNNFFSTNFIFVKKGTRIENSADTNINTIYDDYKMGYPDLLK